MAEQAEHSRGSTISKDTRVTVGVAVIAAGVIFGAGAFVADSTSASKDWSAALAAKDTRDALQFQELLNQVGKLGEKIDGLGNERAAALRVWALSFKVANPDVLVPDPHDPSKFLGPPQAPGNNGGP